MSLDDFFALCATLKRNPHGCKLYPTFATPRSPAKVTLNDENHMSSKHSITRLILERKLKRPIKAGHYAIHSCGNPRCVSENHIFEARGSTSYAPVQKTG